MESVERAGKCPGNIVGQTARRGPKRGTGISVSIKMTTVDIPGMGHIRRVRSV